LSSTQHSIAIGKSASASAAGEPGLQRVSDDAEVGASIAGVFELGRHVARYATDEHFLVLAHLI